MANPFVMYDNIVPVLAPVDIATTATTTPYTDLRNAQKMGFLVMFGAVTSDTATDREIITLQAATAEGGTEAAIAFRYRTAGAVGANTWGAVTTASTAGLSINPAADDNKTVWIEVDPDELASNDYRYVRMVLTDSADMTACLVSVAAILEARYKQTTYISATASASA